METAGGPPKRGLVDSLLVLAAGLLVWAIPLGLTLAFPYQHHESRVLARTAWRVQHELTSGYSGLTLYALSLIAFALSLYRSLVYRRAGSFRTQVLAQTVSAIAFVSLIVASCQIVDVFSMLRTLLR